MKPGTLRPAQLAQYDIVVGPCIPIVPSPPSSICLNYQVVSYQTFQSEIRFVNASDSQQRRTSRFLRHRSPLTMVKFWRYCHSISICSELEPSLSDLRSVCLDEAQLVENPNRAVSTMAK